MIYTNNKQKLYKKKNKTKYMPIKYLLIDSAKNDGKHGICMLIKLVSLRIKHLLSL